MSSEFNEEEAERDLADSSLELPPGEFETFVTGNPFVVLTTLTFCSIDNLPTAVERIWTACEACIEEGEPDFAIELGRALVSGLRARFG